MRFAAYLRQLRQARQMTITELARRIEVTTAYIADIEKRPDKRPPTPQRISKIVAALRLSPEEAEQLERLALEERLPREFRGRVAVKVELQPPREGAGEAASAFIAASRTATLLPLLAAVPAGVPGEVQDDVLEQWPVPPSIARPGHYLLRVKGRSMQPVLEDGDMVLVDGTAKAENRKIVAARIAGGGEDQSTIKQFHTYANRVTLHALNPEFDDLILLNTGEHDESGSELFEYEGKRVRLFLKGIVVGVLWRDLKRR